MKPPIMLTTIDRDPILVEMQDVTGYSPFPHSCVLYFKDRSKIEVLNRMCTSSGLPKKQLEYKTRVINKNDDGKNYKSIRKLLEESENGKPVGQS